MITIVVSSAIFFYFRFLFEFGEGVKAGQLNYVVKKGYIFKTYEGKLIQSGIYSREPGTIESNEFMFSVKADELMRAGGRYVELRYKEYLGALPWRGYSKYLVNEIININEVINTEDPPVQTELNAPL